MEHGLFKKSDPLWLIQSNGQGKDITWLKGNSFWWLPEWPETTAGRMSMNPREFPKQAPDPIRGQRSNGPSSIFHYQNKRTYG
jgi:hypothetical protein